AGLRPDALAGLRGLAEDSWVALLRSACAAALGRAGHVESRQQQAALAVHQILAQEAQPAPVYVFGHTHRVAHRALDANSARLLWFNGGAWADGSYGFVEVEGRADGVVARLCHWDPAARSRGGEFQGCEPTVRQRLVWTRLGRAAAGRGEEVDRPLERLSDRAAYVLLRQCLQDVGGSARLEYPTDTDGVAAAGADEND